MKNKKLIYFLLPLMVVIWGLVFYKVYDALFSEKEPVFKQAVNKKAAGLNTAVQDTFIIIASYRDPFLGTLPSAGNQPKKSEAPKAMRQEIPRQSMDWSFVSYGGIVKNKKTDKMVALLKMNGKDNLVTAGEEVNGVKVLKLYSDSVVVEFQKQKRTIKRM